MNVAARVCRSPDSLAWTDQSQISLPHSPTPPKCSTRAILALINNLGIAYHQYCSSSVNGNDSNLRKKFILGAPSSLSLDDSRLYKIYNEYEICNMQRDGPAGRAGFESMFIDWKTPSPNPGLAIRCASRVGLDFFTFLQTRAAFIETIPAVD
jgi:hypothetical protein